VCCGMMQGDAKWCGVLQGVAECCRALLRVKTCRTITPSIHSASVSGRICVCYKVLQGVAGCCRVL